MGRKGEESVYKANMYWSLKKTKKCVRNNLNKKKIKNELNLKQTEIYITE